MRLPRSLRLTWTRLVGLSLCLVALATYTAYAPPSSADDFCTEGGCQCKCLYAGQEYSEGACRSGQRCVCIHYDTSCSCSWQSQSGC